MRGFNYKKSVQALNYFAQKSGGSINKMKAIKLIWLSDRYHLRKFGRTITGDEYYALPNGPVASGVRDVIESSDFSDDVAKEYAINFIRAEEKYTYIAIDKTNLKVFSETDIEILDLIFENYSGLDHYQLSDLSHFFPEWIKHESALKAKISSRFPIDQNDFFKNIDDGKGLFIDSQETLEISKKLYLETVRLLSSLQ